MTEIHVSLRSVMITLIAAPVLALAGYISWLVVPAVIKEVVPAVVKAVVTN
jgi:hypothetical protein